MEEEREKRQMMVPFHNSLLACPTCSLSFPVSHAHSVTMSHCSNTHRPPASHESASQPSSVQAGENSASFDDILVLLYYSYVFIEDVDDAVEWHRSLCEHLELKGRLRITPEGVNSVLDGERLVSVNNKVIFSAI